MDNKSLNQTNRTESSSDISDSEREALYRRVQERKKQQQNSKQRASSQPKSTVKKVYVKPKKGNRVAFSLILTSIILGVSVIASVTIIFLAKEMFGIDKSASVYTIVIPKEATLDDVIDLITEGQEAKKKEPIIKVKPLFKFLANRADLENRIVSGEHNFSPNMGYSDIIEEIAHYDKREEVQITFTEGTNLRQAADELEKQGVCEAEKFIYYFNNTISEDDYDFIGNIPKSTAHDLRFYRLEGYLFPDTYNFYKAYGEDISSLENNDYEIIVKKILDHFEEIYTDELDARAKEIGMTMDNVITLASIIQKEAGSTEDMYNISSVFHNRLNDADAYPKFQSDPTREYAKEVISKYSESQNTKDIVTAYNTYESPGLPPGPICNPGLEAIKAALYPNDTNYLYFCANAEKQTFYAATYEEHQANLDVAGLSEDDIY